MSNPSEAAQLKEYHGSCHCGDTNFVVKLAPIEMVFSCNCSICSRNAYLWAFPAANEHLTIEREENLQEYEFGNRTRVHKFCRKCGTSVLAKQHVASQGRSIAINTRTIHDLKLDKLEIKNFDGRALAPAYQPPKSPEIPSAFEGLQIYNGSCHCGAVNYSVRSKSLNESSSKLASCDCSICAKNDYLWLYPRRDDMIIHEGESTLTDYIFGKRAIHRFCGTCGVSLFNKLQDTKIDIAPVNARTLNGIDVQDLNVEKESFPNDAVH